MGSAGRTPVHCAVALRRYDALHIMLSTGMVDLALTNGEPDFQTAVDLAEELGHAMISRLLKNHGATATGKRAYATTVEQAQGLSFAGQTVTLTPAQQAAAASNRKLIGVAFLMIFVLGMDWKLTLGACYVYYKMSGGDAAPSSFSQMKAAALPPPPTPVAAVASSASSTSSSSPDLGKLKKQYKEAKAASERDPSNETLKAEYKRSKRAYKAVNTA